MAAVRGRHTDDPARNKVNVKLTDNERNMLDEASKRLNISKSDVIRNGIKTEYQRSLEKK